MLLEQTPPPNIQMVSKTWKKPALTHWTHRHLNRTKWKRKEYKQDMTVFYQALSESKNKYTKRTYEIWRKEVGEHRPYIDANKLANVRRDIINKKRLKETEIEDIKKTVRKQTKTEKPKPEDVAGKNGKLKTRAERKKALKFKYQLNMAQEENEQTTEATKAAKEIKKKAKQDYLDDMKKS